MSGCLLATCSARVAKHRSPDVHRRQLRQQASAATTELLAAVPNGDAGDRAGGSPQSYGEHAPDRVLRFVTFFFSDSTRHALRRRARLMEPTGASIFSQEGIAAICTHAFMAEWSNFESVSSKVRPFHHFIFETSCTWLLMKVVLRGQRQDALRSTLWGPATPNLQG